MGQSPLLFDEIGAWADRTGIGETLQPWEILWMRRASAEWCAQADASTDPACAMPAEQLAMVEREIMTSSMRAALRSMGG